MTLDGKINYVVYYPTFHDTYTAVANMLVINGADVNKSDINAWTPLMYASSAGNEQMVELLISNGADVNAVNRDGATALMVSLTGISSVNIVKMLMRMVQMRMRPIMMVCLSWRLHLLKATRKYFSYWVLRGQRVRLELAA